MDKFQSALSSRKHILAILLIAVIFLTSCKEEVGQKNTAITKSKPAVATTVLPIAGMIKDIAGLKVNVSSLIQKGENPHSFRALPIHLTNLAQASYYVSVGMDLEKNIISKLPNTVKVLALDEVTEQEISNPNKIHGQDEHNHEDHENHNGHNHKAHDDKEHIDHEGHHHDPHLWLDPDQVKASVPHITKMLCQLDSANCQYFESNAKSYLQNLDRNIDSISQILKPYSGKSVFIYHAAFDKFLNKFNLKQESVEIDGKSPTPKQIKLLIKKAKENHIKVIFAQSQFDQKSVNLIAKTISAQVEIVDQLDSNIISFYLNMATKIDQSFKDE